MMSMMMQLIISLLYHLHCMHASIRPLSTAVRDHDEYLDTHRVVGGRSGGDTSTQTIHRHFIRLLHYSVCWIGNTLIRTSIHTFACMHTYLTDSWFITTLIVSCIGMSLDQIDYCCKDHDRIEGEWVLQSLGLFHNDYADIYIPIPEIWGTTYDRNDDRLSANLMMICLLVLSLLLDCVCYGSNSAGDRVYLSTEYRLLASLTRSTSSILRYLAS